MASLNREDGLELHNVNFTCRIDNGFQDRGKIKNYQLSVIWAQSLDAKLSKIYKGTCKNRRIRCSEIPNGIKCLCSTGFQMRWLLERWSIWTSGKDDILQSLLPSFLVFLKKINQMTCLIIGFCSGNICKFLFFQ